MTSTTTKLNLPIYVSLVPLLPNLNLFRFMASGFSVPAFQGILRQAHRMTGKLYLILQNPIYTLVVSPRHIFQTILLHGWAFKLQQKFTVSMYRITVIMYRMTPKMTLNTTRVKGTPYNSIHALIVPIFNSFCSTATISGHRPFGNLCNEWFQHFSPRNFEIRTSNHPKMTKHHNAKDNLNLFLCMVFRISTTNHLRMTERLLIARSMVLHISSTPDSQISVHFTLQPAVFRFIGNFEKFVLNVPNKRP